MKGKAPDGNGAGALFERKEGAECVCCGCIASLNSLLFFLFLPAPTVFIRTHTPAAPVLHRLLTSY